MSNKDIRTKYYLDTEFLEGKQTKRFLGIKVGETKPTIDLISIGIVCETGREYYAISKDFNLKEAWNRYQLEEDDSVGARIGCLPPKKKVYWLRENVLKPLLEELEHFDCGNKSPLGAAQTTIYPRISNWLQSVLSFIGIAWHNEYSGECTKDFSCCTRIGKNWLRIGPRPYRRLKRLIKKHGKTNKQIAEEIVAYTKGSLLTHGLDTHTTKSITFPPVFYAAYANYDWVVFCQLFGTMMSLPEGFPMYCRDLKQMLDEKANTKKEDWFKQKVQVYQDFDMLTHIETLPDYPKQENEHNALDDARWNKKLHEFLEKL